MLAKDKRLNLKKDFLWVKSGTRVEDPLFRMFIKLADNSSPRVGIAVAGKYFKKAVDRNRARRLISKGLEDLYPRFLPSINLIVMPKDQILRLTSLEVTEKLEEVLAKRNFLR